MESRVDMMAIGVLGIMAVGLLMVLTTLLLAAIFGGRTGRIVAGTIAGGLFLLLAIGTVGIFSVRTETYVPQPIEVDLPVRRQALPASAPAVPRQPISTASTVSTAGPQVEFDRLPRAASEHSSSPAETAESAGDANPGRVLGEWAGSLYQGFRNKVNSGDLSLDASSIIPPGRPDWVEQEAGWGPEEVYTVAVSSGPYDRQADCRTALDEQIHEAIGQFANEFLGHTQAADLLGTDLDSLKEEAVEETYREELTPSIGIMHQWHALLKFDESVQQKLRELWETQQRLSRVIYLGGGFAGLLTLLTIFYFCLSLSSETSRVSPWLVSAGTVAALGGLFMAAVIFVRTFPML